MENLRSNELSRETLAAAGAVGAAATEHLVGVDANNFNPGGVETIGDIDTSTLGHSGNGGDLSAGYHTTGKHSYGSEVQFS